jgi:hypothetical protein
MSLQPEVLGFAVPLEVGADECTIQVLHRRWG